jgi:hypothetical protein
MPIGTSPSPAARSPSATPRAVNQHTPDQEPAAWDVRPGGAHPETVINSRSGLAVEFAET